VRLLSWGFQNFKSINLFKSGEQVTEASVWMGKKSNVAVVVKDDLKAIIKVDEKDKLKMTAQINEPIQAPVTKGTEIGTLKIKMGDFPERIVPLYTGEDVAELDWIDRILFNAKIRLMGNGE
jgi:D-alanyl-D-alanine carboxypeptidase (penicillin-binding protein 5/6)